MKKNTKKILALSVLGMFMFMFAMQFVAAPTSDAAAALATAKEAGFSQVITSPDWLVSMVNFMGFGETWSTVIASVAVLLMIFAAAYDILAFTAFESKWTKLLIAGGIAVITSVSRGVTLIVAMFMGIAGGSVAIATVVAIGFAIVFFLIGSFFKGKMKAWQAKNTAKLATGGFAKSAAGVKGMAAQTDAAAEATK